MRDRKRTIHLHTYSRCWHWQNKSCWFVCCTVVVKQRCVRTEILYTFVTYLVIYAVHMDSNDNKSLSNDQACSKWWLVSMLLFLLCLMVNGTTVESAVRTWIPKLLMQHETIQTSIYIFNELLIYRNLIGFQFLSNKNLMKNSM